MCVFLCFVCRRTHPELERTFLPPNVSRLILVSFLFVFLSCRCLRGVEQDFEKAYQMYDRGAAQLDLHSTSFAANLLMRGAGTKPDYEAALRMFRQSEVRSTLGTTNNGCP